MFIRRLREDQRQIQQQALLVDPATVLWHFPDGHRVPWRELSGEGWRTHVRAPQLDCSRQGEGEVDPPFYPGPQDRRSSSRLKVFPIPSFVIDDDRWDEARGALSPQIFVTVPVSYSFPSFFVSPPFPTDNDNPQYLDLDSSTPPISMGYFFFRNFWLDSGDR